MALLAKLSIFGLYQYDPTIFDPLTMPGDLDKDAFVALVMQECAELPTTYPNPDAFKTMLGYFSVRHLPSWQRIYTALTQEYNPLDNYDRYEEVTDQRDGTSTGTSGGTTTNAATAYNTDNFKDTDKSTSAATSSGTSAETFTHSAHIRGNIGVTTSAQMATGEIALRHTTVYREMLRDFMDVFTVGVY